MPQTHVPKDKPSLSDSKPHRDSSIPHEATNKISPRTHQGPKKLSGGGSDVAGRRGIARAAYDSSCPSRKIGTNNQVATAPVNDLSDRTATMGTGEGTKDTIGSHRRRRSSFLKEWATPVSPVRGTSPEKYRQSFNPPDNPAYDSLTPTLAAVSKKSATGMDPLPSPASIIRKTAVSAPGEQFEGREATFAWAPTATIPSVRSVPQGATSDTACADVSVSDNFTATTNVDQNTTPATGPSKVAKPQIVQGVAEALNREDRDLQNFYRSLDERKLTAIGDGRSTVRGK